MMVRAAPQEGPRGRTGKEKPAPSRVVREEIEWLNVWVPGNSVKGLPRVLLIGDSITQGYYQEVADRLKGKAVVARLTTSKSAGDPCLLAEAKLVLSLNRFDVIQFNNGLHGWGYTEGEYAKGLPDLVDVIRKGAPAAKLVWAATTPLNERPKLFPDGLDQKVFTSGSDWNETVDRNSSQTKCSIGSRKQ